MTSSPRPECGHWFIRDDCEQCQAVSSPRSSTEGRIEPRRWPDDYEPSLREYIERMVRQAWTIRWYEASGDMAPDPNPFPRFHLFRLFWKGRKNA